jgi:hypothetical protein
MAILRGKQLSTQLSGSYIISGSTQNLVGTTTIEGTTTVSGSLTLKGPSVDLNIRQNDDTNLARLISTTNGTSQIVLIDNYYHSAQSTIDLNSSNTNAFKINSGSLNVLNFDRDNPNLYIGGTVSSSYAGTGSFGAVNTTGNIESSGRIYESGTSVIDHATAMAIVFGG